MEFKREALRLPESRGKPVAVIERELGLDNAPMESFWATLKRECADQPFRSHDHARVAIFDYAMGFYNRQRKHSALGYLSPVQYAQQQL